MRVIGLGCQNNELADACPLLPSLYKFVHDPMQRLASQSGAARQRMGRRLDPVLDSRGPRDS